LARVAVHPPEPPKDRYWATDAANSANIATASPEIEVKGTVVDGMNVHRPGELDLGQAQAGQGDRAGDLLAVGDDIDVA